MSARTPYMPADAMGQIAASFTWHRTHFTVTGWSERGAWVSVSGLVIGVGAGPDPDDARAMVQALNVVADFLRDLREGAATESDAAPKTLSDFSEGLNRTPLSSASALGVLLAAMAAAESGVTDFPKLGPRLRGDKEVSHGN